MKSFRSDPNNCKVHPFAHWVDLGNGWEITSLPIYDAHEQLCAALGRGPAMAWCKLHGFELPEVEDMARLHELSHFIEPQTLPDAAMLLRDGVPKPWQNADGSDTPHMARYRAANMMGRDWAAIHDYRAWLALAESGWDGIMPVANFGKQWVGGDFTIFGWRRKDGSFIQHASKAHAGEPEYDDYGTTFFAKRPIAPIDHEAPTPPRNEIPPPPDTQPSSYPEIALGSSGEDVRRFQLLLTGAGFALPKHGEDADFGAETEHARTRAEAALDVEHTTPVSAELWAALERSQASLCPGIDVSSNQQLRKFRWDEIGAQQKWLIARATYGVRPDRIFASVIESARAHGMTVGAYHFFRQQQPADEQLQAFFARLDALDIRKGDLLPVIDLEDNERWDGPLNAAAHNSHGRAMVEAVAKRYGRALIYTAPYHYINLGGADWMYEHEIWVADYGRGRTFPRWPDDWAMWQKKPRRIEGYGSHRDDVIDVNVARRLPLI